MMNQPVEPPSAGNLQEWLKWAETKIALSLGVSFYIKPPRAGYADGMLEWYREYLDLCEPQLKWYASELGSYRKATEKAYYDKLEEEFGKELSKEEFITKTSSTDNIF